MVSAAAVSPGGPGMDIGHWACAPFGGFGGRPPLDKEEAVG